MPLNIVFYDGHCGLCNGVVRWLLRIDRKGALRFAPLQGSTAREKLAGLRQDLDALVYWREGQPVRDSSDAILSILRDLGWPWRALSGFLWVPKGFRDAIYRALARRRYRLFGRYESCPLPEPSVRDRFLD